MKLVRLVDIFRSNATRYCRKYSTIEIPKRVKRDEFSILNALNSVTRPDCLTPEYRFIDDPYLIPYSGIDKREFSLSYVSGKEAARYLMKKYPKNFEYAANSHPQIKDFMPFTGPTLPMETIDGLKERITMRLPVESYDSYRKLADDGTEIPRQVLDDLFDLICYTNHEAFARELHMIETFMQDELVKHIESHEGSEEGGEMNAVGSESPKTWKVHGPIENLLQEIKNPSSRNISSLIKGMIKFNAHELAYQEYLKGLKENVEFDVTIYNAVISSISHLNLNPVECWESVLEVLKTMNSKQVAPTTTTFNEILDCLVLYTRSMVNLQDCMKQTLREMKKCGLEPNLTTWWRVLRIGYPSMQARNDTLPFILSKLDKSIFTLQEPTDFEFFPAAMTVCMKNLRSVELARELVRLVSENGCEHLLGNSRHTSSFYSNYLVLLGKYDTMEEFTSEYNRLTPYVYSPSYKVIETMLNAIDDFCSYDLLPKVWSDMVLLRFSRRLDLLEKLICVLGKAEVDSELHLHLVYIVDCIVKQYVDGKDFNKNLGFTGQMVSDMLSVYLKSEETEKCEYLLDLWKENEHSSGTVPSEDALFKLCQTYIKKDNYEKMLGIFKMIKYYGYLCADDLYEEAVSKMDLTEDQKSSLKR